MRRILLIIFVVAATVLMPVTAGASQDQRSTFGIRPATATAPDDRANLGYSATPGAVVHDFVAVSNIGADPIMLKVYASDAFNTAEGGFDLLPANRKPVDIGAWTKIANEAVTVPGRGTTIVPLTLTIPATATAGDHTGGVVASMVTQSTDASGNKVSVEQRVGTRMYLRVSGPVHPALSVDGLTASYQQTANPVGQGSATISYTVRNTGDIRLSGRQNVQISTPWGSTVDVPVKADIPELLPGNSMKFTSSVPAVLPAGWLTGTAHITPVVVPADAKTIHPDQVEAKVTFAAVPWALLGVLALVLLLIALGWYLRRRRARARTVPDPSLTTKEKTRV